jgi:hypothetical protein
MSDLPRLFFINFLFFLFAVVTFLVRRFETAIVIFRLIQPPALIQKLQITSIVITWALLIPLKRDLSQSHQIEAIRMVCISLLRAILRSQFLSLVATLRILLLSSSDTTSIFDFLWLAQMWANSTWILFGYSFGSVLLLGRFSTRLAGSLSWWLLLNLWNLGMVRIQALRDGAITRLEIATANLLARTHVDPAYFFGLIPGLSNFFDPLKFRLLRLWSLWKLISGMALVEGDSGRDHLGPLRTKRSTTSRRHHESPTTDSYVTSIALILHALREDKTILGRKGSNAPFDGLTWEEDDDIENRHYDHLSFVDRWESFLQGIRIDRCTGILGTVFREIKTDERSYTLKIVEQCPRVNLALTSEVTAPKRAKGKAQSMVQLDYLQLIDDRILLAIVSYIPLHSIAHIVLSLVDRPNSIWPSVPCLVSCPLDFFIPRSSAPTLCTCSKSSIK